MKKPVTLNPTTDDSLFEGYTLLTTQVDVMGAGELARAGMCHSGECSGVGGLELEAQPTILGPQSGAFASPRLVSCHTHQVLLALECWSLRFDMKRAFCLNTVDRRSHGSKYGTAL